MTKDIDELRKKIRRLRELRERGEISDDAYRRLLREYEERLGHLKERKPSYEKPPTKPWHRSLAIMLVIAIIMAGIGFALGYFARYPEIQTITVTKALTKAITSTKTRYETVTVIITKTAGLTVTKTVTRTVTKTVAASKLSASEIKYLILLSKLASETNILIHKAIACTAWYLSGEIPSEKAVNDLLYYLEVLDELLKEADSVTPPSRFYGIHKRFIDILKDLHGSIKYYIEIISANDRKKLLQEMDRLYKYSDKILEMLSMTLREIT